MEETTIKLIAAIIALITAILGLTLQWFKTKKEYQDEKKKLQKDVFDALEEKKRTDELNKIIVLAVNNYLEQYLPNKFASINETQPHQKIDFASEANEIKEELREYLIRELPKLLNKDSTLKTSKIEKSIAEAYGISEFNLRDGFGLVDKSKY